MSMDPAMPDWRAFGQPVADVPAVPARLDGRPTLSGVLARVPRSTLFAVLAAVVLAVGGIALALTTPVGGDIALPGDEGDPFAGVVAGTAASRAGGVAAPTTAELVVDVAGGVARPGLVRLPGGSRVGDAIAAAGGYAPTADLAASAVALNLAAPLADGEKVFVPELGTGTVTAAAATGGGAGGGRLDLNAATQTELEALPGIGPVTAGHILEARSQASFATVDELRARGLVGASVFAKLRDLVTVGP